VKDATRVCGRGNGERVCAACGRCLLAAARNKMNPARAIHTIARKSRLSLLPWFSNGMVPSSNCFLFTFHPSFYLLQTSEVAIALL
jgi:hypothetical protein